MYIKYKMVRALKQLKMMYKNSMVLVLVLVVSVISFMAYKRYTRSISGFRPMDQFEDEELNEEPLLMGTVLSHRAKVEAGAVEYVPPPVREEFCCKKSDLEDKY